jgi:hypothetical protein
VLLLHVFFPSPAAFATTNFFPHRHLPLHPASKSLLPCCNPPLLLLFGKARPATPHGYSFLLQPKHCFCFPPTSHWCFELRRNDSWSFILKATICGVPLLVKEHPPLASPIHVKRDVGSHIYSPSANHLYVYNCLWKTYFLHDWCFS